MVAPAAAPSPPSPYNPGGFCQSRSHWLLTSETFYDGLLDLCWTPGLLWLGRSQSKHHSLIQALEIGYKETSLYNTYDLLRLTINIETNVEIRPNQ